MNKRNPYDPCITIIDDPMPKTLWIHHDWPNTLDISEYADEHLVEYKHADSINAFAYNLLLTKLMEEQAKTQEVIKVLVRCVNRIHCLPRTTDTVLASDIENILAKIQSE